VPAEDLRAEAWALATRLAGGPTLAFGEAKNLLLSSPQESLEGQLENEARAMARVTRTDDAFNAMRAVLAKQKPTFQGR
jgi:2-(1,2-epoxy-1,2-dihydrophenyl)acetyl-CoA isomerase